MEKRSWRIEKITELREKGQLKGEEIVERERKLQREERWKKIGESKFNKE